jgi:hypothetical protein
MRNVIFVQPFAPMGKQDDRHSHGAENKVLIRGLSPDISEISEISAAIVPG